MVRMVNPSKVQNDNTDSEAFNWQPYLARGETVEWQARPQAVFRFKLKNLPALAFMIVWLGVVVFIMLPNVSDQLLPLMMTFFFLGIGGWQIYKLVFQGQFDYKKTYYALTARRALIVVGRELRALVITQNTQLRIQHEGGYDSIYFQNNDYLERENDRFGWDIDYQSTRKQPAFAFENIADGEAVYHKILAMQEASS